jgi:hypothetical protein
MELAIIVVVAAERGVSSPVPSMESSHVPEDSDRAQALEKQLRSLAAERVLVAVACALADGAAFSERAARRSVWAGKGYVSQQHGRHLTLSCRTVTILIELCLATCPYELTLRGSRFLNKRDGPSRLRRSPSLERHACDSACVVFLDKPRCVDHDKRMVGNDSSLVQQTKMRCVPFIRLVRESCRDA